MNTSDTVMTIVGACECVVATARGETWGLTIEDQLKAMHLAADGCAEALELWMGDRNGD